MQETKIEIVTGIQTKPRPRFVKRGKFVQTYTPKTALDYEHYIASEYQRKGGKYYGNQALEIQLHFFFQAPKQYTKFGGSISNLACTKHKDLDNLAKSILDALNKVAYDDDKQIIMLQCSKWWTNEQERVSIRIVETGICFTDEKEFKKNWKEHIKNEQKR